MVSGWQGIALNQAEDSANEIHSDRVAQQFGFRGGLVPGVTISAYLMQPAVSAWGMAFLQHGYAHVRVQAPLYDGERFNVAIMTEDEHSYSAEIRQGGDVSATAGVRLAEVLRKAPSRRGDPVGDRDYRPPGASRDVFERLQREGCQAFRYHWRTRNNHPYVEDLDSIPDLLRPDRDGYASMNFLLGISNWVLSSNAHMNPWMHLETRSWNYRAVSEGTALIAELAINDLFERKGHEFVDAEINLYDEADDACVCAIELRAIYKLRGG